MIYISTVTRRGNNHPDWNEDNFHVSQLQNILVGGVFDGCSSARDSYFASKLFANIFKRTIEENKGKITIGSFPNLVNTYFGNMQRAIQTLKMDVEETLSTAILFVYEVENCNLMVKFFGDGVAYSNQERLEIFNNDEANQPDYIGYSIHQIVRLTDFHTYWNKKKSFLTNTKDFSISTDGIFSFKKVNDKEPDVDAERYLVQDTFLYKNPAALKRKLNILKKKGYEHDDDVTIIRIINEPTHEQTEII